ncbi:MAG: adenylyl-sulfate kinase [Bacteroidia bacterium]|jgi:adenylylsulfate kinase|nr:adenylyl-sulfate kinase [Bacteroidia bacterium]
MFTPAHKQQREQLLGQRACVIWLTGLSGAGKTTLANALGNYLHQQGKLCTVLDGDVLRDGLNKGLGFSETDRTENIRRAAETARILLHTGVITICSFISPTHEIRALAKSIIGENDFVEVYVNSSLASCEQRDVKGLYAKARRGEIPSFTGITAPFEAPERPDVEIRTDQYTVEESVAQLIQFISPRIVLND